MNRGLKKEKPWCYQIVISWESENSVRSSSDIRTGEVLGGLGHEGPTGGLGPGTASGPRCRDRALWS